jgi:hypothetical protein
MVLAALLLSTSEAHADPITGIISAVATWYASIGVVGQLLVQVGVSLALSAASYGLSYLVGGAGRRQQQARQDTQGTSIPEFDALLEECRAYGTVTTAGGVFFHKTVAGSGSSGPDRWVLGLCLSEGVCDGLVSVSVNGTECFFGPAVSGIQDAVTAPWFDGSIAYMRASFRTGTSTQSVDPIIAARFPTPPDEFFPGDANRVTKWAGFYQRGICTLVLDMDFGSSADHHAELWGVAYPQILVRLKGLRVFDRTDPAQDPDDSTTWTWSDTATVVIEDYLVAEMGGQVSRDDVADAPAIESIGIDREYIPTLDGTEQRGRINGMVYSSESPISVLSDMLQMNRGMLVATEGQYTIRADRSAAAVATIHKGQWRDQISMQNEPDIRSLIDGIVAQFYPAARYGQSAETAYPAAALDNPTAERVTFKYCDSAPAAQRLAFAMKTENEIGRTISGVFDISVLVATGKANRQLEIGDVVSWDAPAPYDDMNGLYKVDALSINADFSVSLSLTGTSSEVIDGWSTSYETPLEAAA